MARIKSNKYQGVYLNHLQDGDISYSINYKDGNNKKNGLLLVKSLMVLMKSFHT